jgi:general secretion pathway protein K
MRGSALLTVLWLSAALAAVAFALATTVRGETERVSTAVDGLRTYYLATGAIDRAAVELLWSITNPGRRLIPAGARVVPYVFPSGKADVEIIPESAKLNVNRVPVEQLYRLMVALGIEPGKAGQVASAIDAARRPDAAPASGLGNLAPGSSFARPPASFQEIEELLLLPGVTPDIYYGTYVPTEGQAGAPRLMRRDGLADCLTVFDSGSAVDANMATPAVLAAVGLSPGEAMALVERRRVAPLTQAQLGSFPGANLRVGGNSIVTLRATARLRLANGKFSDLRRTVAEQVKFMPSGWDAPLHILRWWDTVWSE